MRARRGMTVLEMMIVLAIIAMATLLLRAGVGVLTKDAIVENSNELIAIMRRSRTLAIEHGEMVRLTMDMDKGAYVVEECKGSLALKRNELLSADPEKKKLALEQAKARLQGMPVDTSPGATDPEDATKRALAVEKGEMHRVIIDTDKQIYAVEMCQGERTISRNEAVRPDEETTKRALEKGKERLKDLPAESMAADPEAATKQALSVAGHHIADRMCSPVDDPSSDAEGKGWVRTLKANKGVKFKEIWVQHRDESVTKGQVAVYFFPNGSSEKAVIEITDGEDTFSVLVWGLTGRVELKDGVLRDVNEHMMRNAMGDKDAKREDER